MDAIAILGIVGGVALLVGFYGGLTLDRVSIPALPRQVRIASAISGALLILFVMWMTYTQTIQPPSPSASDRLQAPMITPGLPTETAVAGVCGELELTFIRPGALLEENMRMYKLLGSGFCTDTLISLSGVAFVGSDSHQTADGLPAAVAVDGTWLTVYLDPAASPNEEGQTLMLKNPDGSQASLFVGFQR